MVAVESLAVALGLSALIGVTMGLLGGGGSILTVPILVYVLGIDGKEAIPMSLVVVGITSAFALISHARAGNVVWRTGLVFGACSMVGAFLGGVSAGCLSAELLMVLFALMTVATAVAMLYKDAPEVSCDAPRLSCDKFELLSPGADGFEHSLAFIEGKLILEEDVVDEIMKDKFDLAEVSTKESENESTNASEEADLENPSEFAHTELLEVEAAAEPEHQSHPAWRIALDGLVVGSITGLVGAAGGFMVVPALVLLAGLEMSSAVGTSLLVITLKSFAGYLGHASHETIDVQTTAAISAVAVLGSVIAGNFAHLLPQDSLRRGFAVFVLCMGSLQFCVEMHDLTVTPLNATAA